MGGPIFIIPAFDATRDFQNKHAMELLFYIWIVFHSTGNLNTLYRLCHDFHNLQLHYPSVCPGHWVVRHPFRCLFYYRGAAVGSSAAVDPLKNLGGRGSECPACRQGCSALGTHWQARPVGWLLWSQVTLFHQSFLPWVLF